MSEQTVGETLAALLDALTLIQGQLEEFGESNRRIEATHGEIMTRLDTLDPAQTVVTNIQPALENILGYMVEDRELMRSGLSRVAQVAGWAHAAARGNGAPLPDSMIDDQFLELYVLTQPADRISRTRALLEWRRVSREVNSAELADLLVRQYHPSPTDTPRTRALRYQLAAITREELEGRGVNMPPPPSSTIAVDGSATAKDARSSKLAQLWQSGESAALYAEPELSGPMDIFAEAERRSAGLSEEELLVGLADLHRTIAARLAAGERPQLATGEPNAAIEPIPEFQSDRRR